MASEVAAAAAVLAPDGRRRRRGQFVARRKADRRTRGAFCALYRADPVQEMRVREGKRRRK